MASESSAEELTCDRCGQTARVTATATGRTCENEECPSQGQVLLLPVKKGRKYVRLDGIRQGYRHVDENSLLQKCSCCETEHAIDNVVVEVRNNQNVYGSVPATDFIRRRLEELKTAREENKELREQKEILEIDLAMERKNERHNEKLLVVRSTCTDAQRLELDLLRKEKKQVVDKSAEKDALLEAKDRALEEYDTLVQMSLKENRAKNEELRILREEKKELEEEAEKSQLMMDEQKEEVVQLRSTVEELKRMVEKKSRENVFLSTSVMNLSSTLINVTSAEADFGNPSLKIKGNDVKGIYSMTTGKVEDEKRRSVRKGTSLPAASETLEERYLKLQESLLARTTVAPTSAVAHKISSIERFVDGGSQENAETGEESAPNGKRRRRG